MGHMGHMGHATEATRETNMHRVLLLVIGVGIFFVMILILWRGSATLTTIGLENAAADQMLQLQAPKKTCEVPSMTSGPIQGAVASDFHMGQVGWNGNSPYTYKDCAANAQEVVDMLQDSKLFEYSKALTKADMGAAVPSSMWFTWDKNERLCKFYLACPGMKSCDDTNTVSGMVEPQGQPM